MPIPRKWKLLYKVRAGDNMNTRRWIVWASIAIAAIVLGYGGAWVYAAGLMRDAVERWAADRRTGGWTVTHGPVAVEGFPFALRARIKAPHMARNEAGEFRAWDGPAVTVTLRPWDMRRIDFSAPGTHRFRFGPGRRRRDATVTARRAAGRAILDAAGRVQRLSIMLGGAALAPTRDGPETAARVVRVTLGTPRDGADPAPESHRRPSLRLTVEIADIDLPPTVRPALGRRIEKFALVAVVKGRFAVGPPAEALAAWRRDGGVIEVERLGLAWAALDVDADGTLALDRKLQPVGAMTARITGFRETVDALVAAGAVRPRDAMTAKIVLGVLAKTPEDGGPPRITAPLSAQDGALYIGPVRLFHLPAIRWD